MRHIHTAVTVKEASEIDDFYKAVLGMEEAASYQVDKELSSNIFGIEKETDVVLVKKDDFLIEIFISAREKNCAYNHVCFGDKDKDIIAERAFLKGYRVFRKKREEKPDLVFIYDKSGNRFEVKE